VHAVQVQEETRTNVVIADAAGKLHVKANEAGPNVTPAEVESMFTLLERDLLPGDICVMTGSLARGIAPDFYARLIALVREKGAHAVLDASAEPLRQGIAARPWLLKINDLEAGQALGRTVETPDDALRAATELHALGIEKVAISLGAQGAVGDDGAGPFWAQTPQVTALNAVGAGDALMGGMIWALAQEPPLSFTEAVRWGVATATAKVTRPSVTYGDHDEVAVWCDKVAIRR
jgi:1-phosphofructokinase family hexose kinase